MSEHAQASQVMLTTAMRSGESCIKRLHSRAVIRFSEPQSRGSAREYGLAIAVFVAVTGCGLWLQKWGYQHIALVYLSSVAVLALFVGRGPILLGTALTGLGWAFFFAPPRYSFEISEFYDRVMFAMYFVVALMVGQLTAMFRAQRLAELKLLSESERLGRTLLNSVSHELRTPLAAITSAATSLRASGPLNSTQTRLATEIDSATARLDRVVQSLLSAARLQSGQVKPNLDWCDIHDLTKVSLREAWKWMAGHQVSNLVPRDLPLVKADFVLLEQALSNLLVNAAAHTPAGTEIEISARATHGKLILEVADNGLGLPAEQLERVFDLFHRMPDARPGGTGLGLAIVKGFVEAQGGTVAATNRPGGGALFTITLPCGEAPRLPEERP